MASADLTQLKAIPITRVAEKLGVPITRCGSGVWGMKDPENPRELSSLRLWDKTNTWKRFSGVEQGGVSGGTNIDLVIHFKGCDVKEAIKFLEYL